MEGRGPEICAWGERGGGHPCLLGEVRVSKTTILVFKASSVARGGGSRTYFRAFLSLFVCVCLSFVSHVLLVCRCVRIYGFVSSIVVVSGT